MEALALAIEGNAPAVQPMAVGDRVLSAAPTEVPSPEEVDDEVAVVIATSGSSGYPKRVALSAAALVASATATEHAVGGPGRWVLAMPAHYVAGVQVLVRSAVAGTSPELLPGGVFTVDAFVDAAERAATGTSRTYTALVPAQVSRLLDDDAGRGALAAFDAVIVGGQAVPAALRERAEAEGVRLVRSYGSSETAGGCVYDGRPLDGVIVRLAGGEIEIGGPTLALGYLGEPERTAAAFRVDDGVRWFRTGDAGGIDELGILDVFGRIDNVIVSGGVNVSLDRVEAIVREAAGFGDAVLVGAEDAQWGSVPVVVTDSRASGGLLSELRRAVEESLGVAARPARIVRLDEIPMLATGKPDRRAIARLVERSAPGTADHGADASTL
jgi:O-succinylbenzoic acid--CoA ligase